MRHPAAGFTLIEVLVALALTAIILVMLAQGIQIGLHGAYAYHRAVQTQSDMEPVERALRNMVERMDPGVYPAPPAVRGTDSALAFTTELPNPAAGGSLTADVRLEADDGRLVLWWSPHTHGIPVAAPPPARQLTLLDGVDRLRISYAAKEASEEWTSSWHRPALPGLVRLLLVRTKGIEAWPPIIVRPAREQAEE